MQPLRASRLSTARISGNDESPVAEAPRCRLLRFWLGVNGYIGAATSARTRRSTPIAVATRVVGMRIQQEWDLVFSLRCQGSPGAKARIHRIERYSYFRRGLHPACCLHKQRFGQAVSGTVWNRCTGDQFSVAGPATRAHPKFAASAGLEMNPLTSTLL